MIAILLEGLPNELETNLYSRILGHGPLSNLPHTSFAQDKNWKMMRFVWVGAWLAFFFGTSLGFGLGSPIRFLSLVGYVVYPCILYALSTDRKAISPRTVLGGLVIQYLMALFVLKTLYVQDGITIARSKMETVRNMGI
jgi:hypothetical protein